MRDVEGHLGLRSREQLQKTGYFATARQTSLSSEMLNSFKRIVEEHRGLAAGEWREV